MMKFPLNCERIEMSDPTTGIRITQITSYPSPSVHMPYDWPSVTPDNQRFILMCQRSSSRMAPYDVFRCDADGIGLVQLTEMPETAGHPALSLTLDGKALYAIWRDEHILRSIDMESGEITDLVSLARHARPTFGVQGIRQPASGDYVFVSYVSYANGGAYALRVDLKSGDVTVCDDIAIAACDHATGRLIILKNFMQLGTEMRADGSRVYTNTNPEPMTYCSVDESGGDEKHIAPVGMFAHSTTLGKLGCIQGPSQPPNRCIWIAEPEKEPWKLVEGPYFWHAGPSWDGEWILSDTNWPDEGLKLVHVPTRRFRTLCHAHGSQGHAQSGHAHPALSQDGRLGIFTSDRTGTTQVYVARITDEFRESIRAGELDNTRDKWV